MPEFLLNPGTGCNRVEEKSLLDAIEFIKQNQNNEKSKPNKQNGDQKHTNGNQIIHKLHQDSETGETVLTTEINLI